MQKKHLCVRAIAFSLVMGLLACSPNGQMIPLAGTPVIQPPLKQATRQRPFKPQLSEPFVDLQAEYAGFRTLALNESYLSRKLRHWAITGNGEGMRREIEFGRYKHPTLLSDILLADANLLAMANHLPEVIAYRQQNPDFDNYLNNLGSSSGNQGHEFQINTLSTGYHSEPAIAGSSNGNFVAAWYYYDNDNHTYSILAQRLNSAGELQGEAIEVSPASAQGQYSPDVAIDSSGNFVVSWVANSSDNTDTEIYAQRFSSAGVAQGSAFVVNSSPAGYQYDAKLGMAGNGNFVISWRGYNAENTESEIYARLFDSAGEPLGAEAQVNTTTANSPYEPAVAINNSGQFVVVWTGSDPEEGHQQIYAQRFDDGLEPQGSEFLISSTAVEEQYEPRITLDSTGNFVVAWTQDDEEGNSSNIQLRRFNSAGVAQGSAVQPQATANVYQYEPEITADSNGNFAVIWTEEDEQGNDSEIYARRYTSSGSADGATFRVNSSSAAYQYSADIAAGADSSLLAAWTHDDNENNSSNIHAKVYPGEIEAL